MNVTCEHCGYAFDDDQPGTYQHAEGWLPRRTQGGANTVALAVRHPRFACGPCIDRLQHGINPMQGDLFE